MAYKRLRRAVTKRRRRPRKKQSILKKKSFALPALLIAGFTGMLVMTKSERVKGIMEGLGDKLQIPKV